MAAPHAVLLDLVRDGQLAGVISSDVVSSAAEHEVLPFVHFELEAGRGEADADVRRHAALAALRAQAQARRRGDAIRAISDSLGPGVRIGVGKGLAFDHDFYGGRCARTSSDIDIHFDGATRERIGEVMGRIDPSIDTSFFNGLAAAGRNFEHSIRVDGTNVDVHFDIINLILPTRSVDTMWDEFSRPVQLSVGPTVWAFDLEMSLMLALIHLARDGYATLKHVLDVRLMIDADPDYDRLTDFAEREGWMPIIRNSHDVVSRLLDRPNPLPPGRSSRLAFERIWPRSVILQGADTKQLRARRQSVVSALVDRRRFELAGALTRRIIPPRAVIDARHRPSDDPYVVALYRWRRSQARR